MTESSSTSFDLVTQPWLPVTLNDGTAETWGLQEFFERAHEAKGLNEPSPLNYTATLRFLIAVLHRAFEGPKTDDEWIERFRQGHFDAGEIGTYLERWHHRFDLYHPERPFAQVDVDEEMADGTKSPIARLIMERTSGNNPTLFDHSWDANPPALSPGDAARAVLTANQYAFAGSGGKFMQAPLVAGYCITLEGQNLFQILMLNLQLYNKGNPNGLGSANDVPWWELETDPPLEKGGLSPRGLTDLLTWRSRKLRLLPESDGTVRWVQYAQRYVVADSNYDLRDPFKRYTRTKSGPSKGKSFPRNFQPDKALWRDIDTLIEKADSISTDETDEGRPAIINWLAELSDVLEEDEIPSPMIVATGLIKDTQASVKLWRMDRLPLPTSVLNDDDLIGVVRDAVNRAETVRDCLRDAGSTFASTALTEGGRSPDPNDVKRERESLNLDARYWSQLESRFQTFMTELSSTVDPEAPLEDWILDLAALARRVFRDATRSAGGDSRWLMAQAEGGRKLDVQMRKYVPEIQEIQQARKEAMTAEVL